jgi:hypothetical protein
VLESSCRKKEQGRNVAGRTQDRQVKGEVRASRLAGACVDDNCVKQGPRLAIGYGEVRWEERRESECQRVLGAGSTLMSVGAEVCGAS